MKLLRKWEYPVLMSPELKQKQLENLVNHLKNKKVALYYHNTNFNTLINIMQITKSLIK